MAHDAHGHGGGDDGDHVPHILPLRVYFATAAALFVLTAITIWVSYQDLGELNLIIALVVATTKACIVATIFMHLFWDHKFHAIIFASSLIFLGIFIWFTMYDTNHRGQNDFAQHERPADPQNPWKANRRTDVQNRATKGVVAPELPKAYEPTLK